MPSGILKLTEKCSRSEALAYVTTRLSRYVFGLALSIQAIAHAVLLAVQQRVEDEGVFLVLLLLGSVLLGLQFAQGPEHFSQAKTSSSKASNLLYKQTNLMRFRETHQASAVWSPLSI